MYMYKNERRERCWTTYSCCHCCYFSGLVRTRSAFISIQLFIYCIFWPALFIRLIILYFWCHATASMCGGSFGILVFNAYYVYFGCCWRLQHLQVYCFASSDYITCVASGLYSFALTAANIYRHTAMRTDDHCNYQTCILHIPIHWCSFSQPHSEFSPSAFSICLDIVSWIFAVLCAQRAHVHRFVFILYDTLAKWNCDFKPWLRVLYFRERTRNSVPRIHAQLCRGAPNPATWLECAFNGSRQVNVTSTWHLFVNALSALSPSWPVSFLLIFSDASVMQQTAQTQTRTHNATPYGIHRRRLFIA